LAAACLDRTRSGPKQAVRTPPFVGNASISAAITSFSFLVRPSTVVTLMRRERPSGNATRLCEGRFSLFDGAASEKPVLLPGAEGCGLSERRGRYAGTKRNVKGIVSGVPLETRAFAALAGMLSVLLAFSPVVGLARGDPPTSTSDSVVPTSISESAPPLNGSTDSPGGPSPPPGSVTAANVPPPPMQSSMPVVESPPKLNITDSE